MNTPLVGIIMGSDSDLKTMSGASEMLEKFAVPYEITVASAHRSPARAKKYASSARERGLKVIIAGAGGAAHLAGSLAAETTLPVIGVPINATPLNGLDALLATVQMPAGVPVATMALDQPGARNAGILAVQILAVSDENLNRKLDQYKTELAQGVEDKAERLKSRTRV
ncbi:MAG: 5-(carboxyamino)imidazole ribonucleotide mutase [Deltaproteobacteria bacterium]|nr:5-(carboxyamino)imidazole ribonucleotide mutase [Deltaproteobacteria bacterium]MBW2139732.1 5-(carboxyamino)imidazole ribonucleotide mutase [Deltaproteobacteria bacterium]